MPLLIFSGFLFQSYNAYIGKNQLIRGAQKWVVFGPVGDLIQLERKPDTLFIRMRNDIYIINIHNGKKLVYLTNKFFTIFLPFLKAKCIPVFPPGNSETVK